jgi:hypothetical protein
MTFCLAATAAGPPPTTGKFDVTFEISLKSIPPGTPINCSLSALVEGETSTITDSMTVAATVTGSHAVCSIGMYYSWLLLNPGSDTVFLSYGTVAAGQNLSRANGQSAMIPVPMNGKATDIFVEVTL